ncbi:MAG TPA: hypothetical protein VEV15_09375, partial [Flavisolibacter sp.]|nr:hypothetical protein [Flavisolibacter sp.]
LTSMASGILVLTYGTYIWQYFWKAPGNKIVGLLMMAGGIAFISSLVFLAILFGILNIDIHL